MPNPSSRICQRRAGPDTRILECHDFSIEFEKDHANIEFTADTIYGEAKIEEVI